MGKGDKRTKRGKIFSGSYGKVRAHKKRMAVTAQQAAKPKSVKKASSS